MSCISMEGVVEVITIAFLFSYACLLSNPKVLSHALMDTITLNQSMNDGETLKSAGRSFELGFFSPTGGNSTKRYLGIWYYKERISVMTVVWVANRGASLDDKSGQLKVTKSGCLILGNATNHLVWSSNTSRDVQNPIAQLLDSGNLVIRDEKDNKPENFLWQSFDHPTDTLLQGMKLGKNFATGQEIYLSSWKSDEDPAPGSYTYHCDPTGYPQLRIIEKADSSADQSKFRTGPWNGLRFNGMPKARSNNIFSYELVLNEKEVYYSFKVIDSSLISRSVLSPDGSLQRWNWVDRTEEWVVYLAAPIDTCATYSYCGPHGICKVTDHFPVCECLEKFVPRYKNEWNGTNWSNGCTRKIPLDCQNGDGFFKYSKVKLPDTWHSWYDESMTLKECSAVCLNNCSCMAYASLDVRGSGCLVWLGDLIDIRVLSEGGGDIYVRMAASELGGKGVCTNFVTTNSLVTYTNI